MVWLWCRCASISNSTITKNIDKINNDFTQGNFWPIFIFPDMIIFNTASDSHFKELISLVTNKVEINERSFELKYVYVSLN